MRLIRDRCEGQLRKRLGDANDGLELADGDGDGGADVGGGFGLRDAVADANEVGGEFFGGFSGESRCAASADCCQQERRQGRTG